MLVKGKEYDRDTMIYQIASAYASCALLDVIAKEPKAYSTPQQKLDIISAEYLQAVGYLQRLSDDHMADLICKEMP